MFTIRNTHTSSNTKLEYNFGIALSFVVAVVVVFASGTISLPIARQFNFQLYILYSKSNAVLQLVETCIPACTECILFSACT